MRNIHRLQIVLFLFIGLLVHSHVEAQAAKNYNFREFQKKPYYFGISLALNSSQNKVFHGRNFIFNDSIAVAQGVNQPGFDVHVIGNLKIGNYFDFRFLPGFSFSERKIEFFREIDNLRYFETIESVFFEAPFHIRYKSAPYRDKRAFVVAGLKYTYDVANNSGTRQKDQLINTSPHDFQFEIGAGIQIFNPYFIFSPEIKFSQGIGNTLIFNDNLNEARIMEKLLTRVLTISFHFEG